MARNYTNSSKNIRFNMKRLRNIAITGITNDEELEKISKVIEGLDSIMSTGKKSAENCVLKNIEPFSSENTEKVVKEWLKTSNLGMGQVMTALRLLMVGGKSKGVMASLTRMPLLRQSIN